MRSTMQGMDLLDLPAVHERLTAASAEDVIRFGKMAGAAQGDAWKAHARAIGELQRRANYGDGAVQQCAKALGIGKKTAERLGMIDRRILYPRLQELGSAATFPIASKQFYLVACQLAKQTRRSALSILAIAEDARLHDRRFSVRKLREHLGVPAESNPARGVARCLATLREIDPSAVAGTAADPHSLVELAEAAATKAHALASELRARSGGAV